MGGGDLNMKKSWHPLLLKNQERVWLEEKKALEEKKKLDQLRKEKEEERQLQELQRLQEEQTGKKRTEKLEWMYTTPATGNSQNPNDLEDYLLGKKRVDKILTADDNAKLGADHKNFIAVQNANTIRDIAAKIREDPLLAIKQQEQAAYQALISNPLRLKEMQERTGIKSKKDKKDKKDKKREKREKRKIKEDLQRGRLRSRSRSSSRSRSPNLSPSDKYDKSRSRWDVRQSRSYDDRPRHRRSPSPYDPRSPSPSPSRTRHRDRGPSYSRSHTPPHYRRVRHDSRSPNRESGRVRVWPRSDESDDNERSRRLGRARSESRDRNKNRDHEHRYTQSNGKRLRSRSPDYSNSYEKRSRTNPPPPSVRASQPERGDNDGADRAARLAAMSANASSLAVERKERLQVLLKQEKAQLEAEERERARSRGTGEFLSGEQKKVFSGAGGLEERLRRGRGGLIRDTD